MQSYKPNLYLFSISATLTRFFGGEEIGELWKLKNSRSLSSRCLGSISRLSSSSVLPSVRFVLFPLLSSSESRMLYISNRIVLNDHFPFSLSCCFLSNVLGRHNSIQLRCLYRWHWSKHCGLKQLNAFSNPRRSFLLPQLLVPWQFVVSVRVKLFGLLRTHDKTAKLQSRDRVLASLLVAAFSFSLVQNSIVFSGISVFPENILTCSDLKKEKDFDWTRKFNNHFYENRVIDSSHRPAITMHY